MNYEEEYQKLNEQWELGEITTREFHKAQS